jgi:hypothetical protein
MENRKQRLVTSYESWNKETAALFELKSSLEKMTVSSITQTQLLSVKCTKSWSVVNRLNSKAYLWTCNCLSFLFKIFASLIPQADKLNVEYKSSQCWAFSIGKTCWIENGSKQPLPVEELLRITEYKWESRCVSKKI